MSTPSLRIPIRADMADFKKAMSDTSALANTAAKKVLKEFVNLNAALGGPIAAGLTASMTRAALTMASRFALVVGAAKLVGGAIDDIRKSIEDMVTVADKAGRVGVSAEFFQKWTDGANGAEDRINLFEKALQNAFQALKPVLNPDWSVWDQGLTKISAVEQAMRETRELFTTDQNFTGLDLFKNAQSQDQKIQAVLTYMRQLKAIGQEVAALDIGEKLFGASFTDQVRLGRESFDEMLRTLEKANKTTFISNEAAANAKELDDRLNDAYRTISERLKPDWNDLASIALRIKSIWVDVLESVARYNATEIKRAPFTSTTANDSVNDPDPNAAAFGNPALLNVGRRRRAQLPQLSGGAAPSGSDALDAMSKFWDYTGSEPPKLEAVPVPRRRPDTAPPPPSATANQRDRFDTSADAIEKRTAALNAETQTLGQNTAAREKARIAATLTATAMQLNAEAGKGESVVTEEQKKRIEEVAEAYEKATASLEKMTVNKEIAFGRKTAFLSQEDVAIAQRLRGLYGDDVPAALNSTEAAALRVNEAMQSIARTLEGGLTDSFVTIINGTASVGDAFRKLGLTVVEELERMLVKALIVGPIVRLLGVAVTGGSDLTGTAFNPLAGLFNFAKADGGYITGPGTSTSDSIPARLSAGEFVVRASSVARPGMLDHLQRINAGVLKFAEGGLAPFPTGGYVGPSTIPEGIVIR